MITSSINIKTIIMLFLFLTVSFFGFSQKKLNEPLKTNLPPDCVLPYKFEVTDYSYKLDNMNSSDSEIAIKKDFLEGIIGIDFNEMKSNSPKKYEYYVNAQTFYNKLARTVKTTFSIQELWYVYMYDVELTNKLLIIK